MTRHPFDRPRTEDATRRARVFLRIDRALRPSRATLALQRRPAADRVSVPQFLRIARGRVA